MASRRRIALYAVGDSRYLRSLESAIQQGDEIDHPDRPDLVGESVEAVYQDPYGDRVILVVRYRPRR